MRTLLPLICLVACQTGTTDFARTGVRIGPVPGSHEGPVSLAVANRTGETLHCEVYEDAGCTSLGELLDPLTTLEPGDRWEIEEVTCVTLDVACYLAPRESDDLPLRTWTWFVQPPTDPS